MVHSEHWVADQPGPGTMSAQPPPTVGEAMRRTPGEPPTFEGRPLPRPDEEVVDQGLAFDVAPCSAAGRCSAPSDSARWPSDWPPVAPGPTAPPLRPQAPPPPPARPDPRLPAARRRPR